MQFIIMTGLSARSRVSHTDRRGCESVGWRKRSSWSCFVFYNEIYSISLLRNGSVTLFSAIFFFFRNIYMRNMPNYTTANERDQVAAVTYARTYNLVSDTEIRTASVAARSGNNIYLCFVATVTAVISEYLSDTFR